MKYYRVLFNKFFICFLLLMISLVILQNINLMKSVRLNKNFSLNMLLNWDYKTLIDFNEFEFIRFHNVCNEIVELDVLVLVHSAPMNVKYRNAIRETWGKSIPGMKLLFMLAAVQNNSIQIDIDRENGEYRDIIQGNFIDAYRNNTYKHVMCFKYTIYYCSRAKYVLKTDDDIYVDMEAVSEFLKNLDKVLVEKELILCYTRVDTPVFRSNSKWAVSFEEYVHSQYPTYCLGPAIIYSYKAVYKLYNMAQRVNYFWIDDVHITGTIAELTNIKRIHFEEVFLKSYELYTLLDSYGRDGPIVFFFSIEMDPQQIYYLHKVVEHRRNLYSEP